MVSYTFLIYLEEISSPTFGRDASPVYHMCFSWRKRKVEVPYRKWNFPLFSQTWLPCTLSNSSPACHSVPGSPVQPSSFIFHAHVWFWSQSRKRRAHSFSNLSPWPIIRPAFSHLPSVDQQQQFSAALFSVSSLADYRSYKASCLRLGAVNIWGQMIPCCGWLSHVF